MLYGGPVAPLKRYSFINDPQIIACYVLTIIIIINYILAPFFIMHFYSVETYFFKFQNINYSKIRYYIITTNIDMKSLDGRGSSPNSKCNFN